MASNLQIGFFFDVEANPACWDGALTFFELKLLEPLPFYALEQLRVRFLHALTTTKDPRHSARALAQMAFETEIGAAIKKMVSLLPEVQTSVVCDRRRYLEIDADLSTYGFLVGPALDVAIEEGVLPSTYVRLFETHIRSPYAKYRMCGVAALLCAAAQLLVPEQFGEVALTFGDAVGAIDGNAEVPGHVVSKGDVVTPSETLNVIPHTVRIETVTAIDAVGFGYGRLKDDTVSTADNKSVVFTALSYWRNQSRPVDEVSNPDYREPVQVHGVDDYEIYVMGGISTQAHLWKWDGTSWTHLTSFTANGGRRIWCNHDGSKIFAFADGGVYRSLNHGASWTARPWPYTFVGGGFHAWENPQTGAITLYASFNQGGWAKSTDEGSTWTTLTGLNSPSGAACNVIFALDDTHVYYGGTQNTGALFRFYDGTTVTNIDSVRTTMGTDGSVKAICALTPNDVVVGGYRFAANNGILLRTYDGFATSPTIQTLPSLGGNNKNNVYSISAVDETEIYATVQAGNTPRVIHHIDTIDLPDQWSDDAAVQNAGQASIAIWVNPATKRGVLITEQGFIQVNRDPAPGRATSPRVKKDDTLSATDNKALTPGKVLNFSDSVGTTDGHS